MPWWPASRSRRFEEVRHLRDGLAMLETVGEHAERENLGPGEGLITRGPVCHHAWKRDDLGDPSAVAFALELYDELPRSHWRTLPASALGRQLRGD